MSRDFWFAGVMVLALIASTLFIVARLAPAEEPSCLEGYVVWRFASDRTLYENGRAESRWPSHYYIIVKTSLGKERIIDLGSGETSWHRADLATPGTYYACGDQMPSQIVKMR